MRVRPSSAARTPPPAAGALALGAALLLAGCAVPDADRTEVDTVLLEREDGTSESVSLPFDLAERRALTVHLRRRVALPAELRGKPVTLALPGTGGPSKASADGEPLLALDDAPLDTERRTRPARYALPAGLTARGELDLDVTVRHESLATRRLGRLVLREGARVETREGLAARVTGLVAEASLAILGVALLFALATYATLPLRRRGAVLAYGCSVAASAVVPAWHLGLTQAIFGARDVSALLAAIALVAASAPSFVRGTLTLPRPVPVWVPGGAALVGLAAVASSPFTGPARLAPFVALFALASAVDGFVVAGRMLQADPRPKGGYSTPLGWPLALGFAALDALPWLGRGSLTGGFALAPLVLALLAVERAGQLSAGLFRALEQSERVADELGRKVLEVQHHAREASVLDDELRRQVAARGRDLSEKLAHTQEGRAVEASALVPGVVVAGRYRVLGPLGKGGMGVVVEVERTTDGRRLALKALTAGDPTARARLAKEAQLAGSVAHPNVVTVLDVDVAPEGFLYVVMELVAGQNLFRAMRTARSVPWLLAVLAQTARGLAAIHRVGVVHRDLKPGNVLVSEGPAGLPIAKISDFGIAGVQAPGAVQAAGRAQLTPSNGEEPLTAFGSLLGTPKYMAPELEGGAHHASSASDVFAFGVLAYEMLARKPPFEVPPVLALEEGRTVPPPVRLGRHRPDLPQDLCALVDHALRMQAHERPTAEALALALEPALSAPRV